MYLSALTWAVGEVVETAIPRCDAAAVAVARPVDAIHPPVGGSAAHISAAAALTQAASGNRAALSQIGQKQQKVDYLHFDAVGEEERVVIS